MLEQAPGCERLARRLGAPELGRPIGDRVLERDVGVTLAQQRDEVVPERAVGIGAAGLGLRGHAGLPA